MEDGARWCFLKRLVSEVKGEAGPDLCFELSSQVLGGGGMGSGEADGKQNLRGSRARGLQRKWWPGLEG